MQTIAVAIRKGGTGKTSTVINLAAALGERGRKVLVLDLDPQHNATDWLDAFDAREPLATALINRTCVKEMIRSTAMPGVSCIPASPMLSLVDGRIAAEHLHGPLPILENCLAEVRQDGWDYLLVDCPPALGVLSMNALRIADVVLSPVPPDSMSLPGLSRMAQTATLVRESANPKLKFRILITMCTGQTRHRHDVEHTIRETYGDAVYETTVRRSVRMAEAWGLRQSVAQVDASASVSDDFRGLAAELETPKLMSTQSVED